MLLCGFNGQLSKIDHFIGTHFYVRQRRLKHEETMTVTAAL